MKVSVIIPVRNEAGSIRALLDNLLAQSFHPDEIVITDGGSTDSTVQIIDEYIQRGAPLKLIKAGPALPGRGRNLAAAASRFEWLAFIDGGIRPENDWLEKLVRAAEKDGNIDVVYGSWAPVIDTFFKECASIAYVPAPAPHRPRSIASSLMRSGVWRATGGFPEDLRSAEDLLFMNEVERHGFRTTFEPGATVNWEIKPSFSGTFGRFVVYARNNIRAGLWRSWQAALLKRYALMLATAVPALYLGRRWLSVPVPVWLAMLLARSIVAIFRNRQCYPAAFPQNIRRLFVLIPLLAVIDLAGIVGSVHWLLRDSFRRSRTTVMEVGDGA